MVLAGDNYTGFAARVGRGEGGRERDARKRRKLVVESGREGEGERDKQMLAEVEFIGR